MGDFIEAEEGGNLLRKVGEGGEKINQYGICQNRSSVEKKMAAIRFDCSGSDQLFSQSSSPGLVRPIPHGPKSNKRPIRRKMCHSSWNPHGFVVFKEYRYGIV